jgi:hypothetical protein
MRLASGERLINHPRPALRLLEDPPAFPTAAPTTAAPVPQTYPAGTQTYDAFLYSQIGTSAQPDIANTFTAIQTFAAAPPASATQAALQIGTGGFNGLAGAFSGLAGGTLIGVNLGPSSARLLDLQVQGVSKLTFGQGGNLLIAGSLTAQGNLNIFSSTPQANAGLALIEIGAGGFSGGAGNFAGSAFGTHVGINAVAGYLGDFLEAQVNGVQFFRVTSAGDTFVHGALTHKGSTAGFYNTAPVSKPTVTGSRGANAALASLLSALASQGLVTDSSS